MTRRAYATRFSGPSAGELIGSMEHLLLRLQASQFGPFLLQSPYSHRHQVIRQTRGQAQPLAGGQARKHGDLARVELLGGAADGARDLWRQLGPALDIVADALDLPAIAERLSASGQN